MLVNRDWLKIVLSVVFRDLWITSFAHIEYIVHISTPPNTSFICQLAGITHVRRHIIQTCRSLTISVYNGYEGEYADQCTDLLEYATTDPHRDRLLPGIMRYENPTYAIPTQSIATIIRDLTPGITVLHFVLIDCVATYRTWDTSLGLIPSPMETMCFPLSLTELHITFAYTSPPPALLLDAPRRTFYPTPSPSDEMPRHCRFEGVRRLVVWDTNPDFVAFLTITCPRLERVESTAQFCAEDLPKFLYEELKDKVVFVRLPRTTAWPGLTDGDTRPIPDHLPRRAVWEWDRAGLKIPAIRPAPPPTKPSVQNVQVDNGVETNVDSLVPAGKKKNPIWRFVKRVFRRRMRNACAVPN
jgi:hypothetical protein